MLLSNVALLNLKSIIPLILPIVFAPQAAIKSRTQHPNELGQIPVIMYHAIGAKSSRGVRYDKHGLNIAPETLRNQLRLMYEANWYPINMREMLSPNLNVPLGKTPVVLTFDDARGTQFTYLADGSLDPDCAVAILEEFHRQHPDWPLKASFYVLPKSKYNPTPFYQPGLEAKKLNYLVQRGFEVANHSTSHRMMRTLNAEQLRWEMAECVRYVRQRAPGATMDTMALPGGSTPRTAELFDVLLNGTEGGTTYHNLCILRAWGDTTYPPAHKKFDIKDIKRIGADPGYIEGWIKRLSSGEVRPYVSDGDPNMITVPKSREKYLDKSRTNGIKIVVWDDETVKPSKKKKNPKSVD